MDLVLRMTLNERFNQLGNGDSNQVARLGVALYQYHSEGLHGVRTSCKDVSDRNLPYNTTEFPQVTGLAATGNMSLIRAMATVVANEARAVNNLADGEIFSKGTGLNYWGPTMNIGRDPRWGRFQESISEDPFLNAAYATATVKGMQGADDGSDFTKIAACCKHFYGYSLESSDGFTRHNFDAKISPRDLYETYLPAFRACAAADVEQVMCSYNAVNGVPTCLDGPAQNGILREEFNFTGMIVSDCDAIDDAWESTSHHYVQTKQAATADGILAGTDMNCGLMGIRPPPQSTYRQGVEGALASGKLPVSALNRAVSRSLAMRFRLGEFDKPETVPYRDQRVYGRNALDTDTSRALALHAAEEAIVLLRNRPSKKTGKALLPLAVHSGSLRKGQGPLRVGVVGPMAQPTFSPDDKDDYCPSFRVSPLQGLKEAARRQPGGLRVSYCEGCCANQTNHQAPPPCHPSLAANFAQGVDVVIVVLGGELGGEAVDWAAELPENQAALATAVVEANPHSVAVLTHGNPMSIDALAERYDAIVDAFEGGQSGGTALAKMLLGESDVAPSGVLPWTVYPGNYTSLVKMSDMVSHNSR